jgi:hypothetical protein
MVLDKIKDVKEAVSIASDLVTLGAAIYSGNINAIASAAGDLVKTVAS